MNWTMSSFKIKNQSKMKVILNYSKVNCPKCCTNNFVNEIILRLYYEQVNLYFYTKTLKIELAPGQKEIKILLQNWMKSCCVCIRTGDFSLAFSWKFKLVRKDHRLSFFFFIRIWMLDIVFQKAMPFTLKNFSPIYYCDL